MTLSTFGAGLAIIAFTAALTWIDKDQTKQKVKFESQKEDGQ